MENKTPLRLYRCLKCGKEEKTTMLIAGLPCCSVQGRFEFVKAINENGSETTTG